MSLAFRCKYLSALHQVRHHDDDLRLLLPDHSPELAETRGHRSLRRDVRLGPVRAVHIVGVNVVRGGRAAFLDEFCWRQSNARVLI